MNKFDLFKSERDMKNVVFGAIVAASLAVPAAAATITTDDFSAAKYNSATAMGNVASEDFETYNVGNVDDGFATDVGTFATIGGEGSGGTVRNASFTNDGTKLAIRTGSLYGRKSTTMNLSGDSADNQFLDSNDTYGIQWNATAGGAMFNKLVITLTDAAEFGDTLMIMAAGMVHDITGLKNGQKLLVSIKLDQMVAGTSVFFTHVDKNGNVKNDGFSLDDASISAVPLPASVLLLLGGLGGMAAVGRRKKA